MERSFHSSEALTAPPSRQQQVPGSTHGIPWCGIPWYGMVWNSMVSPWNVLFRAVNAGVSQVFNHLAGDAELRAWHLPWHSLILPKEPLLQPSLGLPKQTGAWPRGNSLLSLEHIPGTFSSSGYQKTQKSQSSCRDGQPSFPKPAKPPGTLSFAEETLDGRHNTLATGLGDLLGQWQDINSYPGAGG